MLKMIMIALLGGSLFGYGKPAPAFRGQLMGGKSVALQDLVKKDRGLLVLFWASWCVPCIEELRAVKENLAKRPDLGLDVVTINVDTAETSVDVAPTVKLYQIEFPVILDPNHEIFGRYQSAKTLPFSVLVNGEGRWEKTFQGYQSDMFAQIESALKVGGSKADEKKL